MDRPRGPGYSTFPGGFAQMTAAAMKPRRGAHLAKLNPLIVRVIRRLRQHWSIKEIAELWDLNPVTVRRIVNRLTWRHVQ